jgi:phosphatidylglycerol:prolipoprotein diacylglycerol transferase
VHPVLFRIGSLPVNTYGLALAVSFLLGLRLGSKRAARIGVEPPEIANLGVAVMVAAIVGARVFYVVTHWEEFSARWIDVFAIWKGLYGLSMLGGVILAMVVGFAYILRKRWPVWKLADAVIPAFALGIFITRIGCFFNGCCFGRETCSPLGISFPEGSLPWSVFGDARVHPTQLYSSAAGLYMLLVLLLADRRKPFPGFVFCLFMGLYGITRFGLEEFRYFDHDPNLLLGYSQFAGRPGITDNQLISIVALVAALVLGIWLYLRHSRTSATSS